MYQQERIKARLAGRRIDNRIVGILAAIPVGGIDISWAKREKLDIQIGDLFYTDNGDWYECAHIDGVGMAWLY